MHTPAVRPSGSRAVVPRGVVPHAQRRLAVILMAVALALTGVSRAPDAAASTETHLDTGWEAQQGGRALVVDLEDRGAVDRVDLRWRDGSRAQLPPGCQVVVAAADGTAWDKVARAPLTPETTADQSVDLADVVTDRLRLSLDGCRSARLAAMLDAVTAQALTQERLPITATFDDDPTGVSPYPWNTAIPGGTTVTVDRPIAEGSQALVLRSPAGAGNASAWTYLPRTEVVELDFRIRVEDVGPRSVVGLRDNTDVSIAVVGIAEGWLYAFGEEARTELVPAEAGRYYDVTLSVTPGARTFDVAVDGETVATGLRTRASTASVNNVIAAASPGADMAVDDLVVRTVDTTPRARTFSGPFDLQPLPRMGAIPAPDGPLESGWSIGAETLDRDFADFSAYVDDLAALGIPRARLQGGWARTEAVPGTYDWAWLDEAVDGLVDRGIEPWLEFSYGNPAIPDGGTAGLGGALPSGEGRAAWLRWVDAMVERYGDRVTTWYVWNEPRSSTSEAYATLVAETARVVHERQPEARLVIGNTAGLNPDYARSVLRGIQDAGALDLVDIWGYHGYTVNPDAQYSAVAGLRTAVAEVAPAMTLMQTENGAPSQYWGTFALSNHPWTEVSQAKWDLRRMLGDHGRGIDTNVFTISDLRYRNADGGASWNPKGLLQVDGAQQVVRRKAAFRAVQVAATLFDADLERRDDALVRIDADRTTAAFGYRSRAAGGLAVAYWFEGAVPGDYATKVDVTVVLPPDTSSDLVLVDMLDGSVYRVPPDRMRAAPDGLEVRVPAYDAPLMLAERRAVVVEEEVDPPEDETPPMVSASLAGQTDDDEAYVGRVVATLAAQDEDGGSGGLGRVHAELRPVDRLRGSRDDHRARRLRAGVPGDRQRREHLGDRNGRVHGHRRRRGAVRVRGSGWTSWTSWTAWAAWTRWPGGTGWSSGEQWRERQQRPERPERLRWP